MKHERFTYWLSGFFDLGNPTEINPEQFKIIKKQLFAATFEFPAGSSLALGSSHDTPEEKFTFWFGQYIYGNELEWLNQDHINEIKEQLKTIPPLQGAFIFV